MNDREKDWRTSRAYRSLQKELSLTFPFFFHSRVYSVCEKKKKNRGRSSKKRSPADTPERIPIDCAVPFTSADLFSFVARAPGTATMLVGNRIDEKPLSYHVSIRSSICLFLIFLLAMAPSSNSSMDSALVVTTVGGKGETSNGLQMFGDDNDSARILGPVHAI